MIAYRLLSAEKARTPISMSCRLLGVSRSGYYEWAANRPSVHARRDVELTERIRAIHKDNLGVYRAPRIHADLRLAYGIHIGRKRVERLMRQAGISGMVRRKRGRTTISVPGVRVADDFVQRQFRPTGPNQLWVADITYLEAGRAGFTSPPSRTPTAARSSAGAWLSTCAPSSSSTHSRWPSLVAGPSPV